jgi:ketosteroid isomerase-like protein
MKRSLPQALWVILVVAWARPAWAQSRPTPADTAARRLTAEIARQDSLFFDAQFIACDPVRVGAMVTTDLEFYHDQAGVVATSDTALVRLLTGLCQRQAAGQDYRIRRTLVPGTFEVEAIPGYGALATGVHRFWKRTDGQPDELTGIAKFLILWKKEPDGWRMARVVSYNHQPAH